MVTSHTAAHFRHPSAPMYHFWSAQLKLLQNFSIALDIKIVLLCQVAIVFIYKGLCTYYVITDGGGGSLQMITAFGVGQQMGTVLHRGGLANVSSIP